MERSGRSRRQFLAAMGSALAAGVAGCSAPTTREATTEQPATDGVAGETGSPYARVYREAIQSVVLVRVYIEGEENDSQGSGFVYDRRHVVTNEHVVDGGDVYKVQFNRGEWRDARVVGTDAYSDLAVLRVENVPGYAEPLSLVERQRPPGTQVVALGAPFSLSGSVSAGVVSGQNRSLPAPNGFRIADAVQTDAAVNPGNSGGPLVTLDGKVVGVINSGGAENLAFAISAALVRRVVPALIRDGEYRHTYMGVTLRQVTPPVAEANDLPKAEGVIIVDVRDGGPSDGVLRGSPDQATVYDTPVPVGGDVVVSMNGTPTPTQQALSTFLALEASPGDTVDVTVLRDGTRQTVEMTLGTRPPP